MDDNNICICLGIRFVVFQTLVNKKGFPLNPTEVCKVETDKQ